MHACTLDHVQQGALHVGSFMDVSQTFLLPITFLCGGNHQPVLIIGMNYLIRKTPVLRLPTTSTDLHFLLQSVHSALHTYLTGLCVQIDRVTEHSLSKRHYTYIYDQVSCVVNTFCDEIVLKIAEHVRLTRAAHVIQRAWLRAYYSPYHPIGIVRLKREFAQLAP